MKRHWIVDRTYYPAVEVPMSITHATAHVPYSYAFLCPVCGEVWARATVEHPSTRWHALQRPCAKHAEGLAIPGSIWLGFEPEFTDTFPPELVRQEFLLHLNHYLNVREAEICI